MPLYKFNEGQFSLPEGWKDLSVHIFTNGGASPGEFNVVINREDVKFNEDVNIYAARQLKQLEENLTGFRLLEQRFATIGGRHAVRANFTWSSEHGMLRQHQCYFYYNQTALTLTATSLEPIFEHFEKQLALLVESFSLQR